jgi:spore coat protein A, manganese oxidase
VKAADSGHVGSGITRRHLLKLAAATSVAPWLSTGCSRVRPLPTLLNSRGPSPPRFAAQLPMPPALAVTRDADGSDRCSLTLREGTQHVLPDRTTLVWGGNGRFPCPTIEARRGRRLVLRVRNELPVPTVMHLHGGKTPAASDGYPTDLVLPAGGRFVTHGHMPDPRAHVTMGERDYEYPNDQRAATLWYHDHRMDFTGPQVWRGLAGFYLLRDDEEESLPLPRGAREVPLMISDRSFDEDGSLLYPALDATLREQPGVLHAFMGGVLGDVVLVNGAPWPVLDVARVRYRFRLLNASNARRFELTLDPQPPGGPSFVQIGSDGGLLPAPIAHERIGMAPAERFDVIVDFSSYPSGTAVVLRNLAGNDTTASVMQFRVGAAERDDSRIPTRLADYERLDPGRADRTRTFTFANAMHNGESRWLINGRPFDPQRMDAQPPLGSTEIWHLKTDISHPIHLHLAPFQVLSHGGRARPTDGGWKDTLDVGAGRVARVIVRFDGYKGRYAFHCHNLEHEDMAMMANFEVV